MKMKGTGYGHDFDFDFGSDYGQGVEGVNEWI